jgi:hypothetical protein
MKVDRIEDGDVGSYVVFVETVFFFCLVQAGLMMKPSKCSAHFAASKRAEEKITRPANERILSCFSVFERFFR